MKRRLSFVVAAGLSLFGGYLFFVPDTASQTESTFVQPVKTIRFSPISFQETIELSGFLRGERQSDLAPKTNGFVVKLLKEEGETVRQGEIVAILDGTELSAARKSALLSLQSMSRTLSETERYYDQKVDEAKTTLDHASGSGERAAAEEALKSAKRLRDAELAALRTEKTALEGSLLISEASASNAVIRAPFAGIITKRHANLGALIPAGLPIYSLASTDNWEVTLSLPAETAKRVTKGSIVAITNGTANATGHVFSVVSAAMEASQLSTARVRLSASSETAFSLGEHVRVSVPLDLPKETFFVPETAIVSAYDDTFVYAVENGQSKKYSVILGAGSTYGREVVSGLTSDMHIVVEGAHMLSDNQPVDESYDTL